LSFVKVDVCEFAKITLRRCVVGTIGLQEDGDKNKKDVRILIADLGSESSAVRCAAARALGEIRDPQAFEALVVALNHIDKNTKIAAAGALGALGDSRAIEPLSTAMRREHFDTLEAIETSLKKLGATKMIAEERSRRAKREGRARGSNIQNMVIGASFCVLGIIATISSYSTASPGGTFEISIGAIIFGAVAFLRGLYQYLES
jgi:hypothetical protein